ncbi:MAG: DNRLRE domain-containing protein [Candidatus Hodarchaeales archaeon]
MVNRIRTNNLYVLIPILFISFIVFQGRIDLTIAIEPAWGVKEGDVHTWVCTGYTGPENLINDSKCLVWKERQGYENGILQFDEIYIGIGERIDLTVTEVFDTSEMGPRIVLNTSDRASPQQEFPLLYVVSLEMIDYYETKYPYEFNDRGVLLARNYTTEDYLIRLELVSSVNLLESSNPIGKLLPTEDSAISEASPTVSLGNEPRIEVGMMGGLSMQSLLKFSFNNLNISFSKAILNVRIIDYASAPVNDVGIFIITNNWSEVNVSWNSKPDTINQTKIYLPVGFAYGIRQVDITQIVNEWISGNLTNYGILLSANISTNGGGCSFAFYSKENSSSSLGSFIELFNTTASDALRYYLRLEQLDFFLSSSSSTTIFDTSTTSTTTTSNPPSQTSSEPTHGQTTSTPALTAGFTYISGLLILLPLLLYKRERQ